jgi:hypothetical protein
MNAMTYRSESGHASAKTSIAVAAPITRIVDRAGFAFAAVDRRQTLSHPMTTNTAAA